jgi:hypothetical protein
VLLLQFKILLPEGVDTINHGLDELDLRVSKTMFVGNVIGVSYLTNKQIIFEIKLHASAEIT